MRDKVYSAWRTEEGVIVLVDWCGGRYRLNPRQDLRNHSPTGFEFGYGGSGPAQLALALIADALGNDEEALKLYQEFKWDFVARIKGDGFGCTGEYIRSWIRGHYREKIRRGEAISVN